jgi:hypothetical protein
MVAGSVLFSDLLGVRGPIIGQLTFDSYQLPFGTASRNPVNDN